MLTVYIGPNIIYLVGVLSCHNSNAGLIYYNLVIQILKYLFGTLDFRIISIPNSKNNLISYINFDYKKVTDS